MKLEVSNVIYGDTTYIKVSPLWSNNQNPFTIWTSMELWCQEQYGTAGTPWDNISPRYIINNSGFYFRDQKDLVFFMLKWVK